MRNVLILAAAALALGATTPAMADDDYSGQRLNVPREQWLPAGEIAAKLTAQGYKVTEIEADDGVYEVELTKDGVRTDAHVHPATGEILSSHPDD